MCVATLAIAGAVAGAAGSVMGGISQANSAHYQAQVAANNALIEKQNAAYAASAGSAKTEQAGFQARSQLARVRAGEAANGLDVNSGTPADVQESEHEIGDLNTRTVSNNSALQVYGYQTQAVNYQAQSSADEAQVGGDVVGGVLGAVGKLASNSSVQGALGGAGGGSGGLQVTYADDGTPMAAGGSMPSASDVNPSLLSSAPTVPPNYSWMQGGDASDGATA